MRHDRREFLALSSGTLISSLLAVEIRGQQSKGTRVILLGTRGGPRVGATGRNNPSTLIVVEGVPYVVDCGYGASRQLLAAGVPHNSLKYIFITHHHSDHMLEYGPLFYNAWVTGLSSPIHAYGPPGIKEMTSDFFKYMKLDIDIRIKDEGRTDPRGLVIPNEIRTGGVVMHKNGVKVTAAPVPHPMIKYAYAYRFDTPERSIVISGDTAYSPALAELAKNADVLIHEVMYLPGIEALVKRMPNAVRLRQHLLDSHTLPEDVGKLAAEARVKKLVLSHLVPGDPNLGITDDMWTEGVKKHYSGPIVVGNDLMEV